MAQQGGRHRRKVRIFGEEKNLRIDCFPNLGQGALLAKDQRERSHQFRLLQLVLAQQAVGQRRQAKFDDGVQARGAASPASGFVMMNHR